MTRKVLDILKEAKSQKPISARMAYTKGWLPARDINTLSFDPDCALAAVREKIEALANLAEGSDILKGQRWGEARASLAGAMAALAEVTAKAETEFDAMNYLLELVKKEETRKLNVDSYRKRATTLSLHQNGFPKQLAKRVSADFTPDMLPLDCVVLNKVPEEFDIAKMSMWDNIGEESGVARMFDTSSDVFEQKRQSINNWLNENEEMSGAMKKCEAGSWARTPRFKLAAGSFEGHPGGCPWLVAARAYTWRSGVDHWPFLAMHVG